MNESKGGRLSPALGGTLGSVGAFRTFAGCPSAHISIPFGQNLTKGENNG
jgi:hypothetical protein